MENKSVYSVKLYNLFLFMVLYQLLLHFYFTFSSGDPRLAIPGVAAFIHDSALLGIILIAGLASLRFAPSKYNRLVFVLFSAGFFLLGAFLSIYTSFLREYLIFPVNLFESDFQSAETLFSEYLGISAMLPAAGVMIIVSVVIFFEILVIVPQKLLTVLLTVLFVLFFITIQKSSPQPIVYSFQLKIESILEGKSRIVDSLNPKSTGTKEDAEFRLYQSRKLKPTRPDHILLLVLEGVTATAFEKDFLTIEGGYYEENKDRSIRFSNYFSGNLDSYTSLIAMLTGLHVPFRAYSDVSIYEKVNQVSNLTKNLRELDYRTVFISSYEYQPFVPVKEDWDLILERKDLPYSDKWLSLGTNKMESATEDKSAISTIVKLLKENKNTFILHELLYGHSPEWRAKTGKTQEVYYNEYLSELSDELKNNDLYENVLFIVVSDHGERANWAEMENYRVPLVITGEGITPGNNTDFLTHSDLPDIVSAFIFSDSLPVARKQAWFVGSTAKWVYGIITKNKEYLFIDNAAGTVLSEKGGLNPVEIRNGFQKNLANFNSMFRK